jgi:hypothetical protein
MVRELEGIRSNARKATLAGALVDDDLQRGKADILNNLNRMQLAAYIRSTKGTAHGRCKGYERESLFPSIPFDRVIPDVLHLFLRVFDVLFTGLVEDCARHGKPALARLQLEIQQKCRVKKFTFTIGDPELTKVLNDDGVANRVSKRVTWSDMDGGQKLRVLRNLHINQVLFAEEGASLGNRQALWKDFLAIYNSLRRWGWSKDDGNVAFRALVKRFGVAFLATPAISRIQKDGLWVSQRTGGYFPEDVTPYLHCLFHHVPEFMDRYGGNMMMFSCYALEKLNHVHQRWWFSATSHGGGRRKKGAAADSTCIRGLKQIMLKELRMIFNPHQEVRPYPCGHCSYQYKRYGWWARHIKEEHEGTEEWNLLMEEIANAAEAGSDPDESVA